MIRMARIRSRRHRPIELRRKSRRGQLASRGEARPVATAVRRPSIAVRITATVGALLLVIGVTALLYQRSKRSAYEELHRTTADPALRDAREAQSAAPSEQIDWELLHAHNDEVVAWVSVDGIELSLPVVAPRSGDMSYYLTHDFWRQPAFEGTPFLDHRCTADGTHRLAYGHHLTAGGQFSDLQHAWEQECFDTLGTCHWHTPAHGDTKLEPLCALMVDHWYDDIQRFDFERTSDLRSWLSAIASQSSATCLHSDALIARARSVVTLVTCSSDIGNQQWRTLTLFVEPADSVSPIAATARQGVPCARASPTP